MKTVKYEIDIPEDIVRLFELLLFIEKDDNGWMKDMTIPDMVIAFLNINEIVQFLHDNINQDYISDSLRAKYKKE